MTASIWPATLESFCEQAAGSSPAPAAVAVSAVTARLGLGLLIKVLEITGKRKNFAGDSQKLRALIDAARRESETLKNAADDDIEAVRQYMDSRNRGAVRNAIEIPMRAARAAVSGLDLCADSTGMIDGPLVADLGAAMLLLSASVRAILLSVDFNLRQLHSEEQYCAAVSLECREIENRITRRA